MSQDFLVIDLNAAMQSLCTPQHLVHFRANVLIDDHHILKVEQNQ